MSKAEERALEKYPKKIEWVGNQWDGAPFDVNSESRGAYKQGYEQAEKDLELTWEDISIIRQIVFNYNRTIRNKMAIIPNDEEYCKEVLKQFKEKKVERV